MRQTDHTKMTLAAQVKDTTYKALTLLFPNTPIDADTITVNQTKPEFEGDYTVVLFPFLKLLRQKPDAIGKQLGEYLVANTTLFASWQVVAGFLNLTLADDFWINYLKSNYSRTDFRRTPETGKRVMVEYSSPNTNKPLHFGHMRNIFLGAAVSEILKADGNDVIKANLINDRGVHICKSMLAWQLNANGATPETAGIKGDHMVGDYYVRFNDDLKKEIAPALKSIFSDGVIPANIPAKDVAKIQAIERDLTLLKEQQAAATQNIDATQLAALGTDAAYAVNDAIAGSRKWKKVPDCFENNETLSAEQKAKNQKSLRNLVKALIELEEKIEEKNDAIKDVVINNTQLMRNAQEMLRQWEAGDEQTRALWATMNGWVYEGFEKTYKRMGITFDKMYYESNTYLLGKQLVEDGLKKGILFRKEDGSVWIDLKADGLDEKLLLRGDGTSVYITQDMGTARLKYDDFQLNQSIYVIADEQNYHMQVLRLIMQKLGEPCANGIFHLSYGMVELPTGRMKSREGTVVDADDMIDEMVRLAREQTEQAEKTGGLSATELDELYEMIGLGALKFYLLRVEPRKKMIFNPAESIDLKGYTATFIQYAHARICSILRKEQIPLQPEACQFAAFRGAERLMKLEKDMIIQMEQYPAILAEAAAGYNPSVICNYAFSLAQLFSTFYDKHSIARAESAEKKELRLMIIVHTAAILRHSMGLLGIRMPEKM